MDNQPLLQTVLLGTWTPPEAFTTRKHRVGLWGQSRYTPKKLRTKPDPNELTDAEIRVLRYVNLNGKPVRSVDVALALNINTSHAGVLLGSIYKKGKLIRQMDRQRGTRLYIYRSAE